jgi:hypothetical protein
VRRTLLFLVAAAFTIPAVAGVVSALADTPTTAVTGVASSDNPDTYPGTWPYLNEQSTAS